MLVLVLSLHLFPVAYLKKYILIYSFVVSQIYVLHHCPLWLSLRVRTKDICLLNMNIKCRHNLFSLQFFMGRIYHYFHLDMPILNVILLLNTLYRPTVIWSIYSFAIQWLNILLFIDQSLFHA